MVRAKFRCTHVEKYESSEKVHLMAVADEANKEWAKWTPSGQLSMQIDNPDAQGRFKPGGYYFLDFAETSATG